MTRLRLLLPAALILFVAGVAGVASFRGAGAEPAAPPTARELIQLNQDLNDPAKAYDAVRKAHAYLGTTRDSMLRAFLHRGIVTGMIVGNAPGRMVLTAAESALATFQNQPLQQVVIHGQVAQYLVNHHDLAKPALIHARLALLGLPNDNRLLAYRGLALGTLGEAYVLNDRPDSALMVLRTAIQMSPDSQRVLRVMGDAYRLTKKDDLAINAYSRSLAVFLGDDTTAAAPLRALWIRKNGSLKGYEEHVDGLREVSRRRVALDSRSYEREAPNWTLPDLDGKNYSLADDKGKIVVLDFWGTWCGPCREELPIFQKVYERYKDRVVFYGINWERAGPGVDVKQNVRDYLDKNHYSFPVVLDHDRSAQSAYEIEAFPTMFVIDRTGNIRYRNVGVAPGIEKIVTAQIESLLK